MTTTHAHLGTEAAPIEPALSAFRTPVRGHAYAARPPQEQPPHPGQPARLVPEPTNPADPHAIAVWVDDGGAGWRIGYLDRGVAARIAPRLRDGLRVSARIDGWTSEPEGRWHRPLVLLRPEARQDTLEGPLREALARARAERRRPRPDDRVPERGAGSPGGRVWGRPPGVTRRTLGAASSASSGGAGPRQG
jgi:hypothetical protein